MLNICEFKEWEDGELMEKVHYYSGEYDLAKRTNLEYRVMDCEV